MCGAGCRFGTAMERSELLTNISHFYDVRVVTVAATGYTRREVCQQDEFIARHWPGLAISERLCSASWREAATSLEGCHNCHSSPTVSGNIPHLVCNAIAGDSAPMSLTTNQRCQPSSKLLRKSPAAADRSRAVARSHARAPRSKESLCMSAVIPAASTAAYGPHEKRSRGGSSEKPPRSTLALAAIVVLRRQYHRGRTFEGGDRNRQATEAVIDRSALSKRSVCLRGCRLVDDSARQYLGRSRDALNGRRALEIDGIIPAELRFASTCT